MNIIQKLGVLLFIIAFLIFTAMPGLNTWTLSEASLKIDNKYHRAEVLKLTQENNLIGKDFESNIGFIKEFKSILKTAQSNLNEQFASSPPDGVGEWDFKLADWQLKDYVRNSITASGTGWVSQNPWSGFLLTFGLGILGGLMFIIPKFLQPAGIKNDGIYHSSLTKGLQFGPKLFILLTTIVGVLVYGYKYNNGNYFWSVVTAVIALLIVGLVYIYEKDKLLSPPRSASVVLTGWLGMLFGLYLITFYILLYWAPELITNWMTIVSPISEKLSGNPASQWFLYGLMYTIIVLVMGIRMISKYRHNKYQMVRTASVMFFQTAIAFTLPEILVRLNYPYYDFKNIWPLNYQFFFDYNINGLLESGNLGVFMLVWGIVLMLIGVPVITYFYGKRWYCSWVCGCGGLAETLGDPFRQLSDKSLRAWKFERWIIHGVLVAAVVMTIMVLFHYFTGSANVLGISSDSLRGWYGFLIGSAFAGVVGTGFYPLMGNRTWCRFGCPLAAYLGLVQRFKSRFRITTNGGQCISCGNCSTYCEMGIDVRAYAQKGQDIVRSSCVGCGVCSAVCPRGVLRLENASGDINTRADEMRTIHISEDQVGIL